MRKVLEPFYIGGGELDGDVERGEEGKAGVSGSEAGTRAEAVYPLDRDCGAGGIISADRARARGRESILAELGNGPAWVLGWGSYRQNGGGKHGHGKM